MIKRNRSRQEQHLSQSKRRRPRGNARRDWQKSFHRPFAGSYNRTATSGFDVAVSIGNTELQSEGRMMKPSSLAILPEPNKKPHNGDQQHHDTASVGNGQRKAECLL